MENEVEEERYKLECQIYYLEDKLLRSKNLYEQEQLQKDLKKLRIRLQRA